MIFTAIANTFVRIGTAISTTCSKIGSAVVGFAQKVAPVIAQVVDAFKPVADALGKIAGAFLQNMGILQPGQSVEDLGERALQASERGITTDKFDNFDDYLSALRNFELDPNKEHKAIERLISGLAIGTWGTELKLNAAPGSLGSMWLLPMANSEYFTADRLLGLVMAGALRGDMQAYLEKRLSGADASEMREKLEINADGSPMNEAQLDELYEALDKSCDAWDKLREKVQQRSSEGAQ